MLYLLDANVLITAHTLYYPVDRVPEYWAWLAHHCEAGNVKMPLETYEEVLDGTNDEERDHLYAWVSNDTVRQVLVLDRQVDVDAVRHVVSNGYAADLTDDEIDSLGRDPFLIAHGLADPKESCVVTAEVSRPGKKRHNRKIPDVCASLGVRCCDPFAFTRDLRFSTDWDRRR